VVAATFLPAVPRRGLSIGSGQAMELAVNRRTIPADGSCGCHRRPVVQELEAEDGRPGAARALRSLRRARRAGRRPRRGGGFARPSVVLAVAAGGALGAPARYGIGLAVDVPPGTFPWTTFWINLSGSLLLGALITLVIERWPPNQYVRPFLAAGFIGAYTTWSTFTVEADELYAHGHVVVAITYVTASLLGGLAAVYVGALGVRVVRVGAGARR
jgi:CrcB protein